jgi:hypothetical protein
MVYLSPRDAIRQAQLPYTNRTTRPISTLYSGDYAATSAARPRILSRAVCFKLLALPDLRRQTLLYWRQIVATKPANLDRLRHDRLFGHNPGYECHQRGWATGAWSTQHPRSCARISAFAKFAGVG